MREHNSLYKIMTKVVFIECPTSYEIAGLEPIQLTDANVGRVIEAEKIGKKEFKYLVLFNNGVKKEIRINSELTAGQPRLITVDELMVDNDALLEFNEMQIKTLKGNQEYANDLKYRI